MGLKNSNYSEPVSLEDMAEVEETVDETSTEVTEKEEETTEN